MLEALASFVGTSTIVVSLAGKVLGYPHQIKKIREHRTTNNFSVIHAVIPPIAYSLWFVHGIIKQDYVILISQGFGVVVSSVLLFYVLKYRREEKRLVAEEAENS